MDREKVRELLMGYIDDELDDDLRSEVESRLAEDADLRRELGEYTRLKDMTEQIDFAEPTEAEWEAHWSGIYNRLERGMGWICLSIGAILVVLFAAWRFLQDFLLNGEHSLVLRVGVGALTAGAGVMAVSVVRERIRLYRFDRYEEVEL